MLGAIVTTALVVVGAAALVGDGQPGRPAARCQHGARRRPACGPPRSGGRTRRRSRARSRRRPGGGTRAGGRLRRIGHEGALHPEGDGDPPHDGHPGEGGVVPGTPCTATAKACVDIAEGRAWLFDDGSVTRGPAHIMTGDQDDPTPIGTFHVQWKAEQYTSRQYLVQMPYSVFFADGGIAFHEGRQDTSSGGCVKLGHEDAMAWFAYLQVGDEVQVH